MFESTVIREGAAAAGLSFDLNENIFGRGLVALLDFEENKIELSKAREFITIEERKLFKNKKNYKLKVLVSNNTIEVYVDDKFVFHHLLDRKGGKVGLFAERGKVRFTDVKLHALKSFN